MSHVSIIEVQGVTVVRVRPKLEDSAVSVVTELADALTRTGGDGGEDLIIDLGPTDVDDEIAQLLVKATEALRVNGHRLTVVSGHDDVRAALAPYSQLLVSESLDAAAGDLSPAYDGSLSPADHQGAASRPLDPRGY
jgi:anti-anti-sigma regulatory factor